MPSNSSSHPWVVHKDTENFCHAALWLQGSILPDSTLVSQLELPPESFLVSIGHLSTRQVEIIAIHACTSSADFDRLDLHVTMQVALEVKRKQKQKTKPPKPASDCPPASVSAEVPQEQSSPKPATHANGSQTPQNAATQQSAGSQQAPAAPEDAGTQHGPSSNTQTARRVSSAPPDLSPDKALSSKVSVSHHFYNCGPAAWVCM